MTESRTGREVFDLTEDYLRSRGSTVRRYVPYALGGFILGAFALLGGLFSPLGSSGQVLLLLVAALVLGLTAVGVYFAFTGDITRIEVDAAGLHVSRVRRQLSLIRWDDPNFCLDVTELTVPPTAIVGPRHPMALHPQSFLFHTPFVQETTVPKELETRVLEIAHEHRLTVERQLAMVSWGRGTRPPLSLVTVGVDPGRSESPNAVIIRVKASDLRP